MRILIQLTITCLTLNSIARADLFGSGFISGTFSHAQPVVHPENHRFPLFQEFVPAPAATGEGTSTYRWGASTPFRFFLGDMAVSSETFGQTTDAVRRAIGAVSPTHSGNRLTFEGNTFDSQRKGEPFVIGSLEYSNGRALPGSEVRSTLLMAQSFSTDPDFNQQFEVEVAIVTTPNIANDDIASADLIYFPEFPGYGSFRVFEGESTSVELLGEFNSLDFLGFGAVADPTVGFVTTAVPEPTSLITVVVGLFGVSLHRRKRR